MERVTGGDLLVGIEVEPPLAPGRRRSRVPGDRQRLQTAAGKLDEVLLQRLDAEGVGDAIVGQIAVGTVRAHPELVVAPAERADDALVLEPGGVEIGENRRDRGVLPRQGVMVAAPEVVLPLVAGAAGRAAGVVGLDGQVARLHHRRRLAAARRETDDRDEYPLSRPRHDLA